MKRLKTHPILTLDTPLLDAQKKTNLEWNEFAEIVTGTNFPTPSTLPYDASVDEIRDQFTPDADEGPCPTCGAPPAKFRTFAVWFIALALFMAGIGFGFVGGCKWHSHMAAQTAAGGMR